MRSWIIVVASLIPGLFRRRRSKEEILISTLEAMAYSAAFGDERDRALVRNAYIASPREMANGRMESHEGLMLALKRRVELEREAKKLGSGAA